MIHASLFSSSLLLFSLSFALTTCTGEAKRMRAELLLAEEMDQGNVTFTSDSVMRHMVSYYDCHGTANERLKAHYLLGCVYRDLHEAPIALLTWKDAIDCADTTAADCDYITLSRVYGQMADVYYRQYLPEKQLEALQQFCKYALQAGDTLAYIGGLLQRNDAYLILGDTTAIYRNIEHVRDLYLQKGLTDKAAQVYQTVIYITIGKGQHQRADSLMQIYEQQSGLFDDQGNIASPREIYYYYKGMYYLDINQLDSAEYWFRREMKVPDLILNAYHGLMSLYKRRSDIDSTFKYSTLYDRALVEKMSQIKTASIEQAERLYDYHRYEQIAQEQENKAQTFKLALIGILSISILVVFRLRWVVQKKHEEKRQIQNTYYLALDELERAKHEAEFLRQSVSENESTKEQLKDKEERIAELEGLVANMKEQIGEAESILRKQKLDESDIVKTFHTIADNYNKMCARAATSEEWKMMMETILSYHPAFYYLVQKHQLSDLEYKVCVLSYLGFDNTAIEALTNANKGSISNARKSLAKELFHLDSARELNGYLREL